MCYDYSRLLVGLGVQFHRFKVGVKVGVGEVALELLPTSEDLLGGDTPQGNAGQSRCGILEQLPYCLGYS